MSLKEETEEPGKGCLSANSPLQVQRSTPWFTGWHLASGHLEEGHRGCCPVASKQKHTQSAEPLEVWALLSPMGGSPTCGRGTW